MSDPSLSPVELIAEALHTHTNIGGRCTCGWSSWESRLLFVDHQAEVIQAAIRSWPAPTQAQLIGGTVESE